MAALSRVRKVARLVKIPSSPWQRCQAPRQKGRGVWWSLPAPRKAQSKQSVVTTRWYLHYRLHRPTPSPHQQNGLTAEVPKLGGHCCSALWERDCSWCAWCPSCCRSHMRTQKRTCKDIVLIRTYTNRPACTQSYRYCYSKNKE